MLPCAYYVANPTARNAASASPRPCTPVKRKRSTKKARQCTARLGQPRDLFVGNTVKKPVRFAGALLPGAAAGSKLGIRPVRCITAPSRPCGLAGYRQFSAALARSFLECECCGKPSPGTVMHRACAVQICIASQEGPITAVRITPAKRPTHAGPGGRRSGGFAADSHPRSPLIRPTLTTPNRPALPRRIVSTKPRKGRADILLAHPRKK